MSDVGGKAAGIGSDGTIGTTGNGWFIVGIGGGIIPIPRGVKVFSCIPVEGGPAGARKELGGSGSSESKIPLNAPYLSPPLGLGCSVATPEGFASG